MPDELHMRGSRCRKRFRGRWLKDETQECETQKCKTRERGNARRATRKRGNANAGVMSARENRDGMYLRVETTGYGLFRNIKM